MIRDARFGGAIAAIGTRSLHPRDKEGMPIEDAENGYELTQGIEVRSADIDKVSALSRQATELNDTSSLEKDIISVIASTFALD